MFRYFAIAVLTITAGVILVVVLKRPELTAATVNLTMVDYRFNPDHLTFRHDVRYRLHMENHGKETHEVTAPTFFATATIENPDVLNREHTEVVMQPGDVKDMYLTAHKPGTYDLRCSDHDWNGMVGGITVE